MSILNLLIYRALRHDTLVLEVSCRCHIAFIIGENTVISTVPYPHRNASLHLY